MEYRFTSIHEIKNILAANNAGVRKKWGQNFLIDKNYIKKISEIVLSMEGSYLEIGPGLGALTAAILQANKPLTSVEIDPVYVKVLATEFEEFPNFHIIHEDALSYLKRKPDFSVVCGNLPYYISTDLILCVLEYVRPRHACFLLQKEFALRLCKNELSSLYVYAGNFGTWHYAFDVPPGAFYPNPTIVSALVTFKSGELRCNPEVLSNLLRTTYRGKRKKIANAWKMRDGFIDVELLLTAAAITGIDTDRRPEEIKASEYYSMANYLEKSIPKKPLHS